jgi:protein LSM14
MDNLLGSRISLISQQDIRYDGILFSINAAESSIVLRDVSCLGTEERVTDPALIVGSNPIVLAFVSFPGYEIKDLYVHEGNDVPPAPTPVQTTNQSAQVKETPPVQQKQNKPKPVKEVKKDVPQVQKAPPKPPQPPVAAAGQGKNNNVGTGEHLLKMRTKGVAATSDMPSTSNDFDFQASLSTFDKAAVLTKVANDSAVQNKNNLNKYKKDDFFDSLSCDVLDREEGRKTRLNHQEERSLNQDTFGAIALQSTGYRSRNYGGRGGRGRGRGGRGNNKYKGDGRGGRGGNGRGGQGRGQGQLAQV